MARWPSCVAAQRVGDRRPSVARHRSASPGPHWSLLPRVAAGRVPFSRRMHHRLNIEDHPMSRSLFRMPVERTLVASARRLRSRRRAARAGFAPTGETLEDRTLLTTVEVDLINFAFSQSTVTINVGDTIHWV